MNKSERINDMIIYLNGKNYFNIKDLMQKYNISRSTAIRDIRSLETIGMPLFSEHGRHGRYGILKNRLLSPIVFTTDEMYALYFSMLTLQGYQTTPFHLNLSKLKLKFTSCISKEQVSKLERMEKVFHLATSKQLNDSPFLKDIFYAAIDNIVTNIRYYKNTKQLLTVQFFDITSSFGQWYATAYNHDKKRVQVFRCDKIESILINDKIESLSDAEITTISANSFKNPNAIEFEVQITNKGVDIFSKENYPSMDLIYVDGNPTIKGYFNLGEESFIGNYFMQYGLEIKAVKPALLTTVIAKASKEVTNHLNSL